MDLFLEQYSLEELVRMALDELAAYLRSKGKNRFDDSEQVAKSIQKAVRSSYRLDKVVEDTIDTILVTSITVIQTFQWQIKEIDKSITRIRPDCGRRFRPFLAWVRCSQLASLLRLAKLSVLRTKPKLPNMPGCTGVRNSQDDLQQRTFHDAKRESVFEILSC